MNNLKKWKPILDALNVTDEKKREIIADYADFHQINEKSIYDTENLLPVSVRVLAKLNLENKKVFLKNGEPTMSFNYQTTSSETKDLSAKVGLDLVQKVENILIERLVDYLNKELETKDNLYITMLVNSISLISEKTMLPTMILTTRCHVE